MYLPVFPVQMFFWSFSLPYRRMWMFYSLCQMREMSHSFIPILRLFWFSFIHNIKMREDDDVLFLISFFWLWLDKNWMYHDECYKSCLRSKNHFVRMTANIIISITIIIWLIISPLFLWILNDHSDRRKGKQVPLSEMMSCILLNNYCEDDSPPRDL